MKFRPSLLVAAWALSGAYGPLSALAQPEPASASLTSKGQTLPVVTVIDQRSVQRERKDATVSTLIISEEEVERFGDATVGDVLKRLPGMSFTGPAGVVKDIRARGLEKGYTQFLINGEPIPSGIKERQIQVDRLPADMIERIEIIRAPGASTPAHGIGGTINIVLKRRVDELTRLRLATGRNGSLRVGDAVLQLSRSIGDWDVLVAASHTLGAEDVYEEKTLFNAAGALTEFQQKPRPVEKTETLLAPRLVWRRGADRLTLDAFISEGGEDKNESLSRFTPALTYRGGRHKLEDKRDRVARVGVRYDGVADWGNWSLRLGTQQGQTSKDAQERENNAAGIVTKTKFEEEKIRETEDFARLRATWSALAGHRISAGMEWSDATHDNRKRTLENGVDRSDPGAQYRVRERTWTAFLEDEWQLAPGHTLLPGVRIERMQRNARNALDGHAEAREAHANPSLHYRWEPTKNVNVRASLTHSTKLPKFDQLNPLITSRAGTLLDPDRGGNPALRPEKARGVELGLERYFEGIRGVVGANLYHRDVKDYIHNRVDLEGSRWVRRPTNAAEARFWGMELDWRLPLAHKGAHQFNLSGSHAELRGRVFNAATKSWSGVKDMPPRVTSLGVDWTHRPSRWSLGAYVTHAPAFTSDSRNDDGIRDAKTRNRSTMLDLYATHVFSPKAELRLVAKNVLSVKKAESTTKYNAAGLPTGSETKIERSRPTVFLTYEARF